MASGATTKDSQPVFAGKGGEPGTTITLLEGNLVLGSTTVKPSGEWEITPTIPLRLGVHNVVATAMDVVGNTSKASPSYDVTVVTGGTPTATTMDRSGSEFADGTHDPLADQSIAVTAIVVDNGVKPDDFITRDTNLLFTGVTNAANGSHVAVSLNGVFLGYVEVSGGAWTYDHSSVTLSDGNYTLRADLVDAAGNIAVSSFVKQFSIDNSGSLLPDGTRDPLVDGVITITSIETDNPRPDGAVSPTPVRPSWPAESRHCVLDSLVLPWVNAQTMSLFLAEVAWHHADEFVFMVMCE